MHVFIEKNVNTEKRHPPLIDTYEKKSPLNTPLPPPPNKKNQLYVNPPPPEKELDPTIR